LGQGGVSTRHYGPGEGVRCVTATPADVSRLLPKCDVVIGVRAHGKGLITCPVFNGEDTHFVGEREKFCGMTRFAGIRGDFCLIPGGRHGKWRMSEGKIEMYEE
ncbi:unnamed protein product, partial [Sphacelaria rigidula]